MRPQKIGPVSVVSGSATSAIVVSYRSKNGTFNIGVQATFTGSGATGTVQVTMDDPDDFASISAWESGALWSAANSSLSGVSPGVFSGTITSNCFGVRLSISGANTTAVQLTVLQD